MADFGSPGTPSRHEKSLGLLTTKFVSLLQEAKDGVLDLKAVSKVIFEVICGFGRVFAVFEEPFQISRFVGPSYVYRNIVSSCRRPIHSQFDRNEEYTI